MDQLQFSRLIKGLSVKELVMLRHSLNNYREDRKLIVFVDAELKRRNSNYPEIPDSSKRGS